MAETRRIQRRGNTGKGGARRGTRSTKGAGSAAGLGKRRGTGSQSTSSSRRNIGSQNSNRHGTGSSGGSAKRSSIAGGSPTRMVTRMEARQTTLKGRQVSLRTKFMLLMAGLAGVSLVALGFIMARTTNAYLFNQTVHKGVEIVKMAAQVANSMVAPRTMRENNLTTNWQQRLDNLDKDVLEEQLTRLYGQARTWGANDAYSDILSITFYGGGLNSFNPVGEPMTDDGLRGSNYDSIFIPRFGGDVQLPKDIEVYPLWKPVDGRGTILVYRFRVNLNRTDGEYLDSTIRMDIAGDTVQQVRNRLYMTIGIGTLVAILVVVLVAQLFASKITRPLRLLVRDMKIVAKGELSHVTKPHSNDEVGLLALEFNRMTGDLKEAQNILVEQEKAAYELSIASEVQQQLLPAERPQIQGWSLGSFYQGAKAVSGDYYDYIPLGNGLWGFIIADVSGKGVPGSMVMAVTRTIIRLVANKHLANAAETLKETNRLIAKQIKRGMFVTAFYAVLDQRSGQVTFASAGHNPIVVYRAATKQVELAAPKGIAIGFNEGPLFDKNIQQFKIELASGDAMVLYTDGFPEAMNVNDEEWGDDTFYASIRQHGGKGGMGIVEGVVADCARHRGQAAQSDDLTMVAVARLGG